MRAEVVCYISSNEEGENVKVQRVMDQPEFYLFSIGQTRMVVNLQELVSAIETINQYNSVLEMQVSRNVGQTTPPTVSKSNEGEMELHFNTEPTASEIELAKMMEGK